MEVAGEILHTAADGNGPVNALDGALRKALGAFYPVLDTRPPRGLQGAHPRRGDRDGGPHARHHRLAGRLAHLEHDGQRHEHHRGVGAGAGGLAGVRDLEVRRRAPPAGRAPLHDHQRQRAGDRAEPPTAPRERRPRRDRRRPPDPIRLERWTVTSGSQRRQPRRRRPARGGRATGRPPPRGPARSTRCSAPWTPRSPTSWAGSPVLLAYDVHALAEGPAAEGRVSVRIAPPAGRRGRPVRRPVQRRGRVREHDRGVGRGVRRGAQRDARRRRPGPGRPRRPRRRWAAVAGPGDGRRRPSSTTRPGPSTRRSGSTGRGRRRVVVPALAQRRRRAPPVGSARRPSTPRRSTAFEAAGWEERADSYGFLSPMTRRVGGTVLAARRASRRAGRCWTWAAGPGELAAAAAALGADTVGIDVAPSMVRRAALAHPSIPFRVGSFEAIPAGEGTFDAVVGQLRAQPRGTARDRARARRCGSCGPGGWLALSSWDAPRRNRLLGLMLDAVAAADAPPPPGLPAGPHQLPDRRGAAGPVRGRRVRGRRDQPHHVRGGGPRRRDAVAGRPGLRRPDPAPGHRPAARGPGGDPRGLRPAGRGPPARRTGGSRSRSRSR